MIALAVSGWLLAATAAAVACAVHRRRAELVTRACHELAGPLTAAGLALHVAGREAPVPRLAAIDLELRRAARALEDLHAARAGRRAVDRTTVVDVGCLVAQQALAWQGAARQHGCELRVAASSGLCVRADPVRLAQAVGNLLANALEHGGACRVELRAARSGATVRIEVGDDGRGLDCSLEVLTRGARGGRGRRGRGLAIAADIARRHGGRLEAAPSERGARLVLALPAEELVRPGDPFAATAQGVR